MAFLGDGNGFIICYTDGSCINNGLSNASAGYGVVFGTDHPWNEWGPVRGRPTNNVAEIEAATRAIEIAQAHNVYQLIVRTDSQFVIDAYTKYMSNWVQNGWRLADGSPVQNAEEFKALHYAIRRNVNMEVKFQHVPGHSGDQWNMEADRLAKMGAARYRQLRGL